MDLAEGEEGVVSCDSHGVKELHEAETNGSENERINGSSLESNKGATPLFGQKTTVVGEAKSDVHSWASNKHLNARNVNGSIACMALPRNPTLGNVAKVVRSKNCGPFEITFDVIFEHEAMYKAVKDADILHKNAISDMFDITLKEVLWCGFFDQARAFKATIPRRRRGRNVSAGGFLENDVHGSQQYMPLMRMALPPSLVGQLSPTIE